MLALRNISDIIHNEVSLIKNNLSSIKLVAGALPGVWWCVLCHQLSHPLKLRNNYSGL